MSEKLRLRLHDNAHGANRVKGSVKKAGSNKGILAARKEQRRVEAEARQHVRSLIHPAAQLVVLDGRPGKSARERARIQKQMEAKS